MPNKKKPLYAPMLASFGGGSVRGFRSIGGGPKLNITAPSKFVFVYEDNAASRYEQYSVDSSGNISNTYNTSVADSDGDRIASATLSSTEFVKIQGFNPRMDRLQLTSGFSVLDSDTSPPFGSSEAQMSVVGCGPSKFCYLYSDGSTGNIIIDSVDASIDATTNQDSVTSNMGNAETSTGGSSGYKFALHALKIPEKDKILITNKDKCEIVDYSQFNNLSKEGTASLSHTGAWNTVLYTDNPEIMAILTIGNASPNSDGTLRVSYIDVTGNLGPTLLGTGSAGTQLSPQITNDNSGTGPWAYYCGKNRFVYAETGSIRLYELDPVNYTVTLLNSAFFSSFGWDTKPMWMGEDVVGILMPNASNNNQIDVRSYKILANNTLSLVDTFNQNASDTVRHTTALPLYNLP